MMFKKVIFIALFICMMTIETVFAKTNFVITNYHQVFIPCFNKNDDLRIAIRMYYLGNTPYYLAVDPYTFATETMPIQDYFPRQVGLATPGYYTMEKINKTPYIKALNTYSSAPYLTDNYGIIKSEHPVNGEFLTIDMCPSVRPFEKKFFEQLVAQAKARHQAIPIAIAITGLWIIGHPQEFSWLMQQEELNTLQITWINHTFSHVYYKDLPLKNNFLVLPQVNISQEILSSEQLLIEHKQLPSVFFRFPGLISNEKLIKQLKNFGLITVGSNAWLARDQQPKNGSIILVHGNSNEPDGIKKIMASIQQDNFNFLSLSQLFK